MHEHRYNRITSAHKLTVLAIIAMSLFQSGCVGYNHRPDKAVLCQSEAQTSDWDKNNVHELELEGVGKVRFHLTIHDILKPPTYISLDNKNTYWLQVTGFTEWENQFKYQDSLTKNYELELQMLYNSKDAYIETSDGQRVYADRQLYLGRSDFPDLPSENALPSPVDLNSKSVQMQPQYNSLNKIRSVYLRYQIKAPSPDANWKFYFGSIKLGNKEVVIPSKKLCFRKGPSGFYMYHGAF